MNFVPLYFNVYRFEMGSEEPILGEKVGELCVRFNAERSMTQVVIPEEFEGKEVRAGLHQGAIHLMGEPAALNVFLDSGLAVGWQSYNLVME